MDDTKRQFLLLENDKVPKGKKYICQGRDGTTRDIGDVTRDVDDVTRDIPDVTRNKGDVTRGIDGINRDMPDVTRDIDDVTDGVTRGFPMRLLRQYNFTLDIL
ncbi:hypothetical protein J6590_004441 [Homalodisca vitripennis]|nr:hypothetical protein J6590_004441 [Homalodisca vitripennis]